MSAFWAIRPELEHPYGLEALRLSASLWAMATLKLTLRTLAETQRLAATLAPLLGLGDCLLLNGELGAGKSAFSRALIQAAADAEIEVPSPTYTLVQTYPLPAYTIYHYDLYRIGEPDEVYELEWDEAVNSAVTLVEWPSRLEHLTPNQALDIQISHLPDLGEDARLFRFSGPDERWQGVFNLLKSDAVR